MAGNAASVSPAPRKWSRLFSDRRSSGTWSGVATSLAERIEARPVAGNAERRQRGKTENQRLQGARPAAKAGPPQPDQGDEADENGARRKQQPDGEQQREGVACEDALVVQHHRDDLEGQRQAGEAACPDRPAGRADWNAHGTSLSAGAAPVDPEAAANPAGVAHGLDRLPFGRAEGGGAGPLPGGELLEALPALGGQGMARQQGQDDGAGFVVGDAVEQVGECRRREPQPARRLGGEDVGLAFGLAGVAAVDDGAPMPPATDRPVMSPKMKPMSRPVPAAVTTPCMAWRCMTWPISWARTPANSSPLSVSSSSDGQIIDLAAGNGEGVGNVGASDHDADRGRAACDRRARG